jgi:transcription elongation factor Elf1
MSVYIDRKFLGFVSSKLEQFKQKQTDLYNFRCPYCGDSKKNKLKARGYVYRKSNDYFFICHNCGKSTTFAKFVEHVDGTTYKQYILERYAVGETGYGSNVKKPDFEQLKGNAYSRFQSTLDDSRGDSAPVESLERTARTFAHYSIENLPEEHYARDYIKKRKIPEKFWGEILFVPKFLDFLDKEFPNHGKDEVPNDDRVVLLYTNEKGEITNVAGRALSESKIRYVTVKVSDEKKVFGLHRLRKQERIYVVEGQFDSYFLPNCVASGDSNLGGVAAIFPELDVVLVYDNEPRNRDIVKQIEKSIDNGYKVCLFPESVRGKDINEMIQNDLTMDEIKSIIDNNTFSGLTAKLTFTHWKRC